MMTGYQPGSAGRLGGAIGALAVSAALMVALVLGLAVRMPVEAGSALQLFGVEPPREQPKLRIVPLPKRNRRPEGAASPPNLRSTPTEIVAPEPEVVVPPPPAPVVSAPVAGTGADASMGAADIAGPGTGAGGEGDGSGSGSGGDGDGGGWRDETPPEQIGGRIRDRDYPDAIADEPNSGVVEVRYRVEADGRVSGCRVSRSSGSRRLDALTCRLIMERFRFRPARDERGRPVAATMVQDHFWEVDDEEERALRRR